MQAVVKGSYTPLADTLKQVDSITKDDIVKVYTLLYILSIRLDVVNQDSSMEM